VVLKSLLMIQFKVIEVVVKSLLVIQFKVIEVVDNMNRFVNHGGY
jgi:hypothetical protein